MLNIYGPNILFPWIPFVQNPFGWACREGRVGRGE
jgi:hypothetical protein